MLTQTVTHFLDPRNTAGRVNVLDAIVTAQGIMDNHTGRSTLLA